MEKKLVCISCKRSITNQHGTVNFLCPKCGKESILRCADCRKFGAKYTCSQCNFTGPN